MLALQRYRRLKRLIYALHLARPPSNIVRDRTGKNGKEEKIYLTDCTAFQTR